MANQKDVKSFSLGRFVLVDNSGATPQPRPVAVLGDCSIEWGGSTVELRGQHLYPEEVATTGQKVSGKAKIKSINARVIASLLPGATMATGTTIPATETVTAAATVTAAHTTGLVDYGVTDANGKIMTAVAVTTPAVGEYHIASGVYTFNAGETGSLTLNYTYTDASGYTVTHSNGLIGAQTTFKLLVYNEYTAQSGTVHRLGYLFNAVRCPKLAAAHKVTDFADYDIDFECFPDATSGVVDTFFSTY